MAFQDWPEVPQTQRPKKMYVNEGINGFDTTCLREKGWEVVDTRVMPNKTSKDKEKVVLAVLEGVRTGSIIPGKDQLKYLELEARVCGLLRTTSSDIPERESISNDDVNTLLSFGRKIT